jgi:hypothetical protein
MIWWNRCARSTNRLFKLALYQPPFSLDYIYQLTTLLQRDPIQCHHLLGIG